MTGLAGWVQGQGQPWSPGAIQDSVAAIVRQSAYQRSVRATLLDRLLDWLGALIRRFFSGLSEIPHMKWIVLGLAILVLVAAFGPMLWVDKIETIFHDRVGIPHTMANMDFAGMVNVEPLIVDDVEPLRGELEAYLERVRAGRPLAVSAEDGVAAVRLAADIVSAIQTHQWNV